MAWPNLDLACRMGNGLLDDLGAVYAGGDSGGCLGIPAAIASAWGAFMGIGGEQAAMAMET